MRGKFEKNELGIRITSVQGFRGFPPMFHAHMEFIYVLSGEVKINIDDVRHTLTKGQMSMAFPYAIHSYQNAPDAEVFVLLFSPAAVPGFEKELSAVRPVTPYVEDARIFLPLLEKILAFYGEEGTSAKTAEAYLNALLGEILLSIPLTDADNTDLSTTQKILVYCSEHYKENITIGKVAHHCFVSESTVTKIFAAKLGCSFREYINILRISDAKSLLKNTDLKIIEVMLASGYQNQSSFNRVFGSVVGMSPRAYRDKYRKK